MNQDLAESIRLFRADQERALDYLHGTLGIRVPKTVHDWASMSHEWIASVKPRSDADGVTLYAHGYGIEVTHPQFHVDFDYGPVGQCDCFDRWRLSLHRHLRLRLPDPVDDPRPLADWLTVASDSGDLVRVADTYSLFYDPTARSTWKPSPQNSG